MTDLAWQGILIAFLKIVLLQALLLAVTVPILRRYERRRLAQPQLKSLKDIDPDDDSTTEIPTSSYQRLLNVEAWGEVLKRNKQITQMQKALERRNRKIRSLLIDISILRERIRRLERNSAMAGGTYLVVMEEVPKSATPGNDYYIAPYTATNQGDTNEPEQQS